MYQCLALLQVIEDGSVVLEIDIPLAGQCFGRTIQCHITDILCRLRRKSSNNLQSLLF